MIHEYKTARNICGFVEFIAWVAVVIAAVMALMAIGTASSARGGAGALLALVPALWLVLGAFLIIIIVQMARATMDGSVAAQKNVIQSQKHHEEIVRSFKQLAERPAVLGDKLSKTSVATSSAQVDPSSRSDAAAVPSAATESTPRKPSLKPFQYKGRMIQQEAPDRYVVEGKTFRTRADAEVFIDFKSNTQEPDMVEGGNSPAAPTGDERLQPKMIEPSIPEYRGVKIEKDGYKLRVEGRRFSSLDSAKRYIDEKLGDASSATRREPTLSIQDDPS